MGQAIVRRIGSGSTVVLADADDALLARVTDALQLEGFTVHAVRTDVSSADDVSALAKTAAELGPIRCVVHTAGVSPVQATPQQIIDVDLVGTARVLDAFEPHVQAGTVAVCIASMAGSLIELDRETEQLLAATPTEGLSGLSALDTTTMTPAGAYPLAKRANQVRVAAASVAWGRRGGRVVSISPGVIATPMGRSELAGPFGDGMREMVENSGCGRVGTPDDIAATVEFLTSSGASYITGIDLLVDGGTVAALFFSPGVSRPG